MNGLAVCAGIGGLELGLRILWPGYRTVCHVERESYAAATLVARMAEQALDQAPIWDDLSTFDGKPWRGKVDCLAGGIPCQPFSAAGKRHGLADERWLGSDLLRVVDEVRPRILVLENVPGFAVAGGLNSILGGLEEIEPGGWRSEWLCLPASAVGAPHRRERFFGLFVSNPSGSILWDEPRRGSGAGGASTPKPRHLGAEHLADSHEPGRSGERVSGVFDGERTERRGDPDGRDRQGFPPGPTDSDGWREWLDAGGPAPTLESRLRGGTDGPPTGLEFANDRLRCLGNAVVPLQAAAAVGELARRMNGQD